LIRSRPPTTAISGRTGTLPASSGPAVLHAHTSFVLAALRALHMDPLLTTAIRARHPEVPQVDGLGGEDLGQEREM
jgi:hypothetical protein